MKLTKEQEDLIAGSLLGDGSLQTETRGRNWRYRAIQKDEHKPYLEHKFKVLENLCGSPIKYSETLDDRTGKLSKRWTFNTLTQDCLRDYGNMFYTFDPKTNLFVKDVPMNVEQILTPAAVAYWYQDDGAIKWLGNSNAMRICTESFSIEGTQRLADALQSNFQIKVTLNKKTVKGVIVGYRIFIPEASSEAFRELIRPYLIDCMRYKVSDGKRGHL